MAIKTSIISQRFPYIPLQVQVRRRQEKVEALLDTGFDGDIAIPKGLLTNGDPPDGFLPWQLADGSKIVAPAYKGKVKIGNIASFPVVVIALGDEPIVGQGVIKNLTLILDHGKKVIIQK